MMPMRYRPTACASCGNHTVLATTGMCLTCVSEPFPRRSRRFELALIYAAGIAIAAAFVLMVLTGHIR